MSNNIADETSLVAIATTWTSRVEADQLSAEEDIHALWYDK